MNAILQEADTHPWVASIPYEDLARTHLMNSNPPRQWQVEFTTPTTFNTGRTTEGRDHHLPFPLPESLLKSWLRRWQAFAPIALPEEELLDWARTNLAVSSYRLHSLPAREAEHLRVGCVGSPDPARPRHAALPARRRGPAGRLFLLLRQRRAYRPGHGPDTPGR